MYSIPRYETNEMKEINRKEGYKKRKRTFIVLLLSRIQSSVSCHVYPLLSEKYIENVLFGNNKPKENLSIEHTVPHSLRFVIKLRQVETPVLSLSRSSTRARETGSRR